MSWKLGRSERICAVIDLGSHKINCALLSYRPGEAGDAGQLPQIEVHGFASGPSAGWCAGRVQNMGAAEKSLRRVVARAEQAAGVEVRDVFVVTSFQSLHSEGFRAGLPLIGETLSRRDFGTIVAAASEHAERGFRRALHVLATGYALQPQEGGHRVGGSYLSVDFQTVSITRIEEDSLHDLLGRCQLHAEAVIAAPYASALAVTSPEDRELGALVLDLGARTTGLAWLTGGTLEHLAVLAEGGQHVTARIARNLSLDRAEAERLKVCHGSVFDGIANDAVLAVGAEEDKEPIFKSQLNAVIRDRLAGLLQRLHAKLAVAGLHAEGPEPLIVTGGGSALPGAAELAAQIFGRKAYRGKPVALNGLKADATLSALTGGCLYVASEEWRHRSTYFADGAQRSSYADRIGQWLRASF